MARPIDPELRENLMADVLEAVARLGLGNLSLRAVSRELGVSPRMLLYHFGSRDGLLDAIVAETSRRLAAAAPGNGSLPEVVRSSWRWMTAPRQRGFRNVFYEVCALGAREPARRGVVASSLFTEWHARLVRGGLADTSATLLLATLHGLLLDLVLTNEPARIERAFEAFLTTISVQKVTL